MNKHEKTLERMYFEIGTTLMDNDIRRKGIDNLESLSEVELLRSSREVFIDLKVLMMQLQRELYGEKSEEDKTEISCRNTSASNSAKSRHEATCTSRFGDFSCPNNATALSSILRP